MAKRKLSQQQRRRIRERERERITRPSSVEGESSGETGLIIAHHGKQVELEDARGERHRCHLRANLDQLVAGDRVLWQPGSKNEHGVVVAVEPRHSELRRPDPYGRLKPLAANVDRLLVVLAPVPTASSLLVDRYLVAAELSAIEPVLVFNKADLLDEPQTREAADRLRRLYTEIGYDFLEVSASTGQGIEPLQHALEGHTGVLAGQSGVGKSALVNALLPEAQLPTGSVSDTGLGQHTTTAARLFHLPGSGDLIDSPGVREFGLWHISEEELLRGYRDLAPLATECRFRNCSHRHEPGCALHAAVEEGRIDPQRMENFFRIAETLDPGKRQKY